MNPLVSILIPCYNAGQWLAETLESALAQTWQNKEIILVDDGSTDNSLEVAKQFESRGVKVIPQQNKGAGAARNRALSQAEGDFLQYLDADDLLAPDKIERQIQLLQDGNSQFVAAGEWARFYQAPAEAKFTPEPVWHDMPPVDWLICSWEGGGMMHPAAWLIPRALAHRVGFWNETRAPNDDAEYFCRVVLASLGVKFCYGAKSYYRSGNTSSLSSTKSRAGWESAFHILELCTQHLLAKEDSPRTRHACATSLLRLIYAVYPDAPELVQQLETQVKLLGGSNLKPSGGAIFQLTALVLGWKLAKQIQRLARSSFADGGMANA